MRRQIKGLGVLSRHGLIKTGAYKQDGLSLGYEDMVTLKYTLKRNQYILRGRGVGWLSRHGLIKTGAYKQDGLSLGFQDMVTLTNTL